jgi:hypothetical protein
MEGINSYGVTLRDADIVHNAIRTDTKVKFVESMSTTPSLLSMSYTLHVSIIIKKSPANSLVQWTNMQTLWTLSSMKIPQSMT